ncbi:MAG: hypothetical protein U9R26_02870 [Campylobacterota bacterium]|nr:hypothetical protein [Campylobacterota bacterium]
MKWLLIGVIAAEAVVILYLLQGKYRLKKELRHLHKKHKAGQKTIVELQEQEIEEPIDKLATHDKIVEMFESGVDAEVISEQLEIPQNKVEMTLRFEKMKKYGSQ